MGPLMGMTMTLTGDFIPPEAAKQRSARLQIRAHLCSSAMLDSQEGHGMTPNQAHSLDGASVRRLQFRGHWRAASDAHRYA